MNFQQAVQSGFSNYANFRSRACRSEFLVVAIISPSRRHSRRGAGPVRKFQRLWRLAARDLVLARHHYSRSRHHGAQAPRYRFKWLVDFARFDPVRGHDRLDRLVVPRGQQRLQPVRGQSASASAEQAGGFVARKQIKQLPQGLPARRLQFRIAGEHQRCIVARCRQ